MLLFVGLGNPKEKYEKNRHNVGFMLADFVANKLKTIRYELIKDWTLDKYVQAEIAELKRGDNEWIFAKPQTYMNKSGESVKMIIKTHDFKSDDLYVAHDDLDIPLGKFKIQLGTGPKLHNGLESIQNHLHTMDFWRIRIGVENRGTQKIPGETYVLQNFTEEERKIIDETFNIIFERLIMHLSSKNKQ